VATAVTDVNRDGVPDLLVSNSGSNDVSQLNGLGADSSTTTTRYCSRPGSTRDLVLGDFDGDGTLDLVVVNAGSNDLTLLADLARKRTTQTLASGGVRPLAAAAGDVNRDGRTDLFIAHNGDGRVTLFLGTARGPAAGSGFVSPEVEHPTGLALSASGTTLFVGEEGRPRRPLCSGGRGRHGRGAGDAGWRSDGRAALAGAEGVTLPGETSLAFFATLVGRQGQKSESAATESAPVKEVAIGVSDLVGVTELSGDDLARRLMEGGAAAEAAIAELRARAVVRHAPVLAAAAQAIVAQLLRGVQVLAGAGTLVAGNVGSTLLAALGSLTDRSGPFGVLVRQVEMEAPSPSPELADELKPVVMEEPVEVEEQPRKQLAIRMAGLPRRRPFSPWALAHADRVARPPEAMSARTGCRRLRGQPLVACGGPKPSVEGMPGADLLCRLTPTTNKVD
jgi:hypothetical protein